MQHRADSSGVNIWTWEENMISPLSALLHFLWVFVDGTWISSVLTQCVSVSFVSFLSMFCDISDRFKQHFDDIIFMF